MKPAKTCGWLLLILAGATAAGAPPGSTLSEAGPALAARVAGVTRTIQAATSTGRRGTYYLPSHVESATLPLLVMLHGTGGTGAAMILRMTELAERERFIAVAPDSVSVAGVWAVRSRPDDMTEDYRHVVSSVREVMALPGVRIERIHVLAAGFSVGGGAAFQLASREDLFTAFAVLHGHVPLDGLGRRRVRGWLSTGDRDRVRTVESITSAANHLIKRERFPEVEFRVFRADHTLGDEELSALVAWWLRRPRAATLGERVGAFYDAGKISKPRPLAFARTRSSVETTTRSGTE